MKHIDLTAHPLDSQQLLALVEEGPLTLVAPNGKEYLVREKSSDHPKQTITHEPGILSGEPIITNTRTPVRAIVEMWQRGMPPEAIPHSLPHLTLSQVFDALSYFSANRDEILHHIERNRIPEHLIDPRVRNL